MGNIMFRHIGLILVVIGTFWLAFSLTIRRQYADEREKVIDEFKKKEMNLLEPTEATVNRFRFWIGLVFIAVGTLMQW